MSGLEWSVRCKGCGLASPRIDPGACPVSNPINGRFEMYRRDRDREGEGEGELGRAPDGLERVVVCAPFGLPPTRFEPPLVCPRCGGLELEANFGGGWTPPLESLERFVASTFAMVPGSTIGAVGAASVLWGEGEGERDPLVSIDFLLSHDGAMGRWYIEADTEAARARVVRDVRALLVARGSVEIAERVVWSGVYLDDRRAPSP